MVAVQLVPGRGQHLVDKVELPGRVPIARRVTARAGYLQLPAELLKVTGIRKGG